nr:MAG TPA: hypothetical protein [Caudoviricetes sp.]
MEVQHLWLPLWGSSRTLPATASRRSRTARSSTRCGRRPASSPDWT